MRTTVKDYSNTNNSIITGIPSAADIGNYFYLPALGFYVSGQLVYNIGVYANYWSSSAYPWSTGGAYRLTFYRGIAGVYAYDCNYGYIAQPFSDFGDN